ncbi:hypothetical protein [Chryseobacterium sp.]|uniref:hypothetical protein n=1 Tax=Chryseobacterium sp. TaxID=1871047 RepID=UPI000EDD122C|nr:hypothetical protein [Chryseobacterium sp.]HCM34139.1 hypothetical protein [Chryseobacterium sp.]
MKSLTIIGAKGAFKNALKEFSTNDVKERVKYKLVVSEPNLETTITFFSVKKNGVLSSVDVLRINSIMSS